MAELKRTFTGGRMEKDTDERIVQNGLYREALNISVSTSEDSDVGAAQNLLGNIRVTDMCNHSTPHGNDEYFMGYNHHVAAIVNPQDDKIYRFVHTISPDIMMDRIMEFDTSKDIGDGFTSNEKVVFCDIHKVIGEIDYHDDECWSAQFSLETSNKSTIKFAAADQWKTVMLKWGMSVISRATGGYIGTIEHIDYSTKEITLDRHFTGQNLVTWVGSDQVDIDSREFHFVDDRVLNFGWYNGGEQFTGENTDDQGIRKITGLNIVDDMLFWTDNYSEPKKINIKRSIEGSEQSTDWKHTLLMVNGSNPVETIIDESHCATGQGCTDPTMFNYDATATHDCNGDPVGSFFGGWNEAPCCESFTYGCTDPSAANYDAAANIDDGSCCYSAGCTDPTACNYEEGPCFDDGSCTYGGCEPGCTDSVADNYDCSSNTNAGATSPCSDGVDIDDGSCIYTDIWITDIDNCECINVPFGTLTANSWPDEETCNADNIASFTTGCCNPNVIYGCTDPLAFNYDSNADCSCNAEVGPIVGGWADGFTSTGVGCDNTNPKYCNGPGSNNCCVYEISGCTDPNDINYNPLATTSDLNQCGGVLGCIDPNACNYDPNATLSDESCEYDSCAGCTDSVGLTESPGAYSISYTLDCNNEPLGTENPGWNDCCVYTQTFGCDAYYNCVELLDGTGPFLNYETCLLSCYLPSWDCTPGGCVDPGTGNGQYATLQICQDTGCEDAPQLTTYHCDVEQGQCIPIEPGDGSYPAAYSDITSCEDNCSAISSTWSCDGFGSCNEETDGSGGFADEATCLIWCNVPITYNCVNDACIDPGDGTGSYSGATAFLDCQDVCGVAISNDGWYCDGSSCIQDAGLGIYSTEQHCIDNNFDCSGGVLGCTNPLALNYDPAATIDNGSCTYAGISGCMDDTQGINTDINGNFDANGNGYFVINFNPAATSDDGSCQYVAFSYQGADKGCQEHLGCDNINVFCDAPDNADPANETWTTTVFNTNAACERYTYQVGCDDPLAMNYRVSAEIPPYDYERKKCWYPGPTADHIKFNGVGTITDPEGGTYTVGSSPNSHDWENSAFTYTDAANCATTGSSSTNSYLSGACTDWQWGSDDYADVIGDVAMTFPDDWYSDYTSANAKCADGSGNNNPATSPYMHHQLWYRFELSNNQSEGYCSKHETSPIDAYTAGSYAATGYETYNNLSFVAAECNGSPSNCYDAY